jgi:hypothetical protein
MRTYMFTFAFTLADNREGDTSSGRHDNLNCTAETLAQATGHSGKSITDEFGSDSMLYCRKIWYTTCSNMSTTPGQLSLHLTNKTTSIC